MFFEKDYTNGTHQDLTVYRRDSTYAKFMLKPEYTDV